MSDQRRRAPGDRRDPRDRDRRQPARGAAVRRQSAPGRPRRPAERGAPRATQRATQRPSRRRPARRPRAMRLGVLDRRVKVGFAAVATLLLVIGGRLVQLQGLDHSGLAGAAAKQRVDTVELHALRGSIVDRDGTPLAFTSDAQDITADPKQVEPARRAFYARTLAPLLGESQAAVLTALAVKGQYTVLARALSPTRAQHVTDLGLAGIYTQATTERQYPGRTTAANVIGTVHTNGNGAAGIEAAFNSVLAGRNGRETYSVDNVGNVNPSSRTDTVPARNGSTVKLTLDQNLQFTAQQYLDKAVPESEAKSAEMAVLDAHTGQVLALASSGTFDAADPNTISSTQPIDPPVMSVFEPGSVQKAITFAAALQQGVITPKTVIKVPDAFHTGGVRIADAWPHATSPFYATGILAESSNVGTLKIANRLGPKTWYRYEKRFGVGDRTGIELPGESSGYVPPLKQWSASTFANLPFGQGENMTVLQLASIYQAIANDGVRVPPRIVQSVTAADGSVRITKQPKGIKVIDPATDQTLRTMLQSVTLPGGTGVKAAIPGYEVAGKTGTAQQPQSVGGAYSTYKNWDTFAGMVPADNPQFVVAIMVDNPAHGVEGGDVAAPLFHEIASYELAHAKVPPTGYHSTYTPLQDCKGQNPAYLPLDVCHE